MKQYEKSEGWKAGRVTGLGYDLESIKDDTIKKIEVKGLSKKSYSVILNYKNYEAFNHEDNFWLYVVYDIESKSKLIRLSKEQILNNELMAEVKSAEIRLTGQHKNSEDLSKFIVPS